MPEESEKKLVKNPAEKSPKPAKKPSLTPKKAKIKKIFSISFWSVLIILVLVFAIRVLTWETAYYSEKIGSPRAVAETASEEEVDETEPTATEVAEYKVAADRPRYLSISAIGVTNARVIAVGINSKQELSTPSNIFDVGWYDSSSKPGQGGTILIDGHNGGPHVYGVFKRLPLLCAKDDTSTRSIETGETKACTGGEGDKIVIERGDGTFFTYEVIENVTVALSDSDKYMNTALSSPVAGVESLSLITCTGEWSQSQKTYLSRQFLRAILIE